MWLKMFSANEYDKIVEMSTTKLWLEIFT